MRLRRLYLLLGLGVGYVLGTRAGRERYEALRDAARRLADRPEVQETAGIVAAQVVNLTRHATASIGGKAKAKVRAAGISVPDFPPLSTNGHARG